MKRRLAPWIAFGSVIFVIAIAAWKAITTAEIPPDPSIAKRRHADRVFYYRVTLEQSPRFDLSPRDTQLELITHAVVPNAQIYDPARRLSYGLHITITDGDDTLWDHDVYTETRQSKGGREGDLWLQENAFTRRGELQLGDDRMLVINLPRGLPTTAIMYVALLGDTPEVLVRVYSRSSRSRTSREKRIATLTELDKFALVASNDYRPWDALTNREQYARLRNRFLRLSAIGERGVDYDVRSIYYTGFRLPPERAAAPLGFAIDRLRGLAVNVASSVASNATLTPTRLEIVARRTDTSQPVRIAIEQIGTDKLGQLDNSTAAATTIIELPVGRELEATSITLGSRLQTVQVTCDSAAPVELQLHTKSSSPFTYRSPPPRRGKPHLIPDQRHIPLYTVSAGGLAAVAELPDTVAFAARAIRVDARLVAVVPGLSEPASGALSFEFSDSTGTVLQRATRTLVSTHAPFERLTSAEGEALAVSEPVSGRVLAPAKARFIRFTSDMPIALRLYAFVPGDWSYEPPYRDANLGELAWRYAPLESRTWYPFRPSNHRALADAHQKAMLTAQVRLREPGEARSAAARSLVARAVVPAGRPERQLVVEPVPSYKRKETVAAWPPGATTSMPANQPHALALDRGSPGRAAVRYWAKHADLGSTVALVVDDAVVATYTISASRGRWRLPRLAQGEHRVELRTRAQATRMLIDRPPAENDGANVLRLRTLYKLGADGLRVAVRRRSGRAVTLNAVVYHPSALARPEIVIHAVVGGGNPARVTGVPAPHFTSAVRDRPLPEARDPVRARFADLQGRVAGYPRAVPVTLGTDLAAGSHIIELSVPRRSPVWVRFFVMDRKNPGGERALQWKFTE